MSKPETKVSRRAVAAGAAWAAPAIVAASAAPAFAASVCVKSVDALAGTWRYRHTTSPRFELWEKFSLHKTEHPSAGLEWCPCRAGDRFHLKKLTVWLHRGDIVWNVLRQGAQGTWSSLQASGAPANQVVFDRTYLLYPYVATYSGPEIVATSTACVSQSLAAWEAPARLSYVAGGVNDYPAGAAPMKRYLDYTVNGSSLLTHTGYTLY